MVRAVGQGQIVRFVGQDHMSELKDWITLSEL